MRTLITSILGLVMVAFAAMPAQGGTLEAELDFKIRAIAEFMKSKDFETCSMQPIGGISLATGTNRIGAMVQEKLAGHDIEMVGTGAAVQLDIEVSLGSDDATLFIDLELKTDRGQKLRDWTGEFHYEVGGKEVTVEVDKGSTTATIDHADDVLKILEIPYADHEPQLQNVKKANKKKLKKLAEVYDAPQATIKKNTYVSTHESGLYQMEVLITKDVTYKNDSYHAVPVSLHNNLPFVNLTRGDMIGVRLINNSDKEAYVELCLDGINSYHFSTLNAKHYLVPPHKSIVVKGFHQRSEGNIQHYKHFQISAYAESAWLKAQESGFASVTDAQGSISAHFSKQAQKVRGGNDRSVDLIGQGTEFSEKAKTVTRKVGPVIETVVVRYQKPQAH